MKLPLLPNGASLNIAKAEGVLGGTVWPSAGVLCQHLLDHYHRPVSQQQNSHQVQSNNNPFQSCNVLELGSGTGAVGIFAASLGIFRSVHLTEHKPPVTAVMSSVPYAVDGTLEDLEMVSSLWDNTESNSNHERIARSDRLLKLLARNVEQNDPSAMPPLEDTDSTVQQITSSWPPSIHELNWTIPEHVDRILQQSSSDCSQGFELLLASDVTYFSGLHGPLATTIARLLKPSSVTPCEAMSTTLLPQSPSISKCLVAHQTRVWNFQGGDSQLHSFETALKDAGLDIVTVHNTSSSSWPSKLNDDNYSGSDGVCIFELQLANES